MQEPAHPVLWELGALSTPNGFPQDERCRATKNQEVVFSVFMCACVCVSFCFGVIMVRYDVPQVFILELAGASKNGNLRNFPRDFCAYLGLYSAIASVASSLDSSYYASPPRPVVAL